MRFTTASLKYGYQRLGERKQTEGNREDARIAFETVERLRDFAELITFLTGRDADEYLRDAKTTGYPPLTSQSDVRTTVLGDSAPSNENPQ